MSLPLPRYRKHTAWLECCQVTTFRNQVSRILWDFRVSSSFRRRRARKHLKLWEGVWFGIIQCLHILPSANLLVSQPSRHKNQGCLPWKHNPGWKMGHVLALGLRTGRKLEPRLDSPRDGAFRSLVLVYRVRFICDKCDFPSVLLSYQRRTSSSGKWFDFDRSPSES